MSLGLSILRSKCDDGVVAHPSVAGDVGHGVVLTALLAPFGCPYSENSECDIFRDESI